MDGAEERKVNQCPVCTCPHSELDRTDVSHPYCNTESVKRKVDASQSEHLDDDGEVKERHKDKINQNHTRYHIRYRKCCLHIIYDIVSDIVPDWSPDTGGEVGAAPQAQT